MSTLPDGRASGVLLHPTSLPGPYGIGDLGPAAYAWVDALAAAGQRCWQVLPLGPTGFGDSPYQCFSAFAGNPNLISPAADANEYRLPLGPVDYDRVAANKRRMVQGAAAGLELDAFRAANADWLDEFALFMALKHVQGGASWQRWPDRYRLREAAALGEARRELANEIDAVVAGQFVFHSQWAALRQHAHNRGVSIIGDMPIFVAEDSADVWAHPELFLLDAGRRPRAVAGVPPDYFSATGQLWGNPLYDWAEHERTGFAWWLARVEAALRQVDLIRLDHFRGFEAYWEVPVGSPTAEGGRWVPGPEAKLLTALRNRLGRLPLIAEDLGVITPAVDELRQAFGLPGMRILQFAFGGAVEARFLPHNYRNPTVVYTGTHDNDTVRGWFDSLTPAERRYTCDYLGRDGSDIAWDMIRTAWASTADLAIVPAQDLLGLGAEARMNTPGRPSGNWRWRLPAGGVPAAAWARLAELTRLYERQAE